MIERNGMQVFLQIRSLGFAVAQNFKQSIVLREKFCVFFSSYKPEACVWKTGFKKRENRGTENHIAHG
jgi:hypothetical protein